VLYAGLGLLATLVGVGFIRVLYTGEDLADRLWRGPEWLRPGVGGILLGLLLLAVPQMYGVGYPVLERAVAGHYLIPALLGLLVAKLLATSLTMWIGGSGGVFAPSLFMGAMLGATYGAVAHHLLPNLAAASGAYGLVGMGAVFAATARAPITAVIIVFELTGDYKIILPLMFAIVVATAVSNRLTRDTIYTLKLRRRGVDIDAPGARRLMARTSVIEAMGPPPRPLHLEQPASEIIARFAGERSDSLPVTDATGLLLGVVAAVDLEQAVTRDSSQLRIAADLMREAPTVRPEDSLEDGVAVLAAGDDEGIPVTDAGGRLVGWLTHRRVLRAYGRQAGLEVPAGDPAGDPASDPVVDDPQPVAG
jgi:chloride channel protein, CIC family